jgi:hypothetical protein
VFVLSNNLFNPGELLSTESLRSRESHRFEPELRDATITPNVNVWRFSKLVRIEEEPVGSDDFDRRRHLLVYSIDRPGLTKKLTGPACTEAMSGAEEAGS